MPEEKMRGRDATYELRDGIARFTINRPERRNALSADLRLDFADLVAEVSGNDEVGALIITGAGGAFCAGGDTSAMAAGLGGPEKTRRRVLDVHAWLEPLANLDCPVIAAVDGVAYGGGFSLALVADFILASDRARFCSVFGRIGLIPDMAMFYTLPRMVGSQKAKELMLTARSIDAQEALQLGIALSVHKPEDLMPAAEELAGRLRHGSKTAQALTKSYLQQTFHNDYAAMREMEAAGQSACFETDYHREAIRRFADKEPLLYNWDAMRKDAASASDKT
jgi:2-(1,2-epoxy-1,2-dihydrophenyl)acetyl-CoA isomerase